VAFVHYRFVIDHDVPVLYCYEIQVEPEWQNRGLGGMLIDMLCEMASRWGVWFFQIFASTHF